jgi:hypothetical protein
MTERLGNTYYEMVNKAWRKIKSASDRDLKTYNNTISDSKKKVKDKLTNSDDTGTSDLLSNETIEQ